MRNVYIVLVPLCFGLTSGFIVPSGIQEIFNEVNSDSIHSSGIKTRSLLHMETNNNSQINRANINKSVTVEISNDSLNIDLYEHSQSKNADIKERSFIYTNQRIKKPIRDRFYEKPTHEGNVEISDKPDHRCHTKLKNEMKENSDTKAKLQSAKEAPSEQRQYLELMKAPLLRPEVKHNNNNRLERLNNNLLSYIPINNTKAKIGFMLLNPLGVKKVNSVEIKKIMSINNLKENASDEYFTIDIFGEKINHNVVNEKLQLDNFKQELNENQAERDKNSNSNRNPFHICRDCINKARKHKHSSRLILETTCKCGHNVFLRESKQIKQ